MRDLKHCGVHRHKSGCRPARPLCKLMRLVRENLRPCDCGAYPFPHRNGSGLCGSPARMNAILYGGASSVSMKEIALSRGMVTLVDDECAEELLRFKWSTQTGCRTFYAVRRPSVDGTRPTVWMHREITGAPRGMDVDHIDGNGLNNQRSNLRVVTRAQNKQNQTHKRKDGSSRFKGVSWQRSVSKWRAEIKVRGQNIYLGIFSAEEAARDAYAAAAAHYFGKHSAPYVEVER